MWMVGGLVCVASEWLVFGGRRVGVWNVAIGGGRDRWMSWLVEMEEMEEDFCGVGMVDVGFPRRKIWSLVLEVWRKGRGRWRPRRVVIRRFRPPWSEIGCDFLSLWV